MKVITAFTFCRNILWKSKFMALEKPGILGDFFLLLCGHPLRENMLVKQTQVSVSVCVSAVLISVYIFFFCAK